MQFASKVIYGTWPYGGTQCRLVFKSNQQFVASTGEIVQEGVYRKEICTVSGRNRTIPLISSIPATTDAMPNDATWEIYFEEMRGTRRDALILGAKLPATYPDPVAWQDIINFNAPPGFTSGPAYGISYDQAALMIQRIIGQVIVQQTGTGTLIAGEATVLSSLVGANSPIEIISIDEGVIGPFRVFNRVPGVSFQVESQQGSDAGNFRWNLW